MGNKHEAKKRRKGGPPHFKKRRFHSNRSTKIDSTLPVEQMETTADIAPVTSVMHRKLTINNDNYLSSLDASSEPPYSPAFCGSDDDKLPFHYLFLDSSILKSILSLVGVCPICSSPTAWK